MSYDETTFLDALCDRTFQLQLLFALSTFFFVLSVITLIALDPGDDSYPVATMNFLGSTFFMVPCGIALYKCRERALEKKQSGS